MKHSTYLLAIAVAIMAFSHTAQSQTVVSDDFNHLLLHYKTPTPEAVPVHGQYKVLEMDGYTHDAAVGSPQLPVTEALIAVPMGAEVEVVVSNAVYDTLPMDFVVYPMQPSRCKSDTVDHDLVMTLDQYKTKSYVGLPLAEAHVMGIMRDRRLATLRFAPVQVNHRLHRMVVCRQADVEVRFLHPDAEATLNHYNRYHSPAFAVGKTLNNLFTKTDVSAVPVRMVVVAASEMECHSLQRFVDWKNKQGIATHLVYTSQLGGSDTTTVSNYLQSLYDTASVAYPAPTYVLLVGDHDLLPARQSHLSSYSYYGWYSIDLDDHITDLYHVTWDGSDALPEAYVGRFSALDTTTLASIVNKTLLYEQYAFSDDAYLGKAILIAGVDGGYQGDNAYTYCDPTMDYIARFYINSDNGFNTVKYYKNRTNFAPTGVTVTGSSRNSATATTLRNLYSEGYGWINYSAHGDWDQWVDPMFTSDQVGSMNNTGKPSIMIGNCCLSNRFQNEVCFGEALLRRADNAGAVAYIGGTAETYWEQDFYWAVGVRNNISGTMTPTYSAANLGMYDRLFHTHNEAVADQAIAMGNVMYAGNLAVNSSNPSDDFSRQLIRYYWEIYTLMGDPSLMPWLGTAADLDVFSMDAQGNVATAPYAYVALVDADLHVLSAAYADADGNAALDLGGAAAGSFISVSAQGYKPYFYTLPTLAVDSPGSADTPIVVYPNPAADRAVVAAADLQAVELYSSTGQHLFSAKAQGAKVELDLAGMPYGLLLVRATTSSGIFTAKLLHR